MIRPATNDDVPAMVALGDRFNRETPYAAHFAWNPEAMRQCAEQMIASENALVLVVEAVGAVVGMLGALLFTHPLSGERTVSEVFWWVNPEQRGGGIRLMRQAERWATEQGATRMLMIAPDGTDVGRVYTKLGYQPLETSYQRSL